MVKPELIAAALDSIRSGWPARRFKDFRYATLDSWSQERRVIGKAEVTGDKANPRFIVTSLKPTDIDGRRLYEKVYCARGEMENRIKECQLDLFADRTSAATRRANQLRCGSPRWPMCCSARFAASGWLTRSSPTPPAAPSGSGC